MTISITGEPTGDYSPQMMPHVDLATDEAKAFLLASCDGDSPVDIADSRTAFQVESAIAARFGRWFSIRASAPGFRRVGVGCAAGFAAVGFVQRRSAYERGEPSSGWHPGGR